jgi:hypothetical protein
MQLQQTSPPVAHADIRLKGAAFLHGMLMLLLSHQLTAATAAEATAAEAPSWHPNQ